MLGPRRKALAGQVENGALALGSRSMSSFAVIQHMALKLTPGQNDVVEGSILVSQPVPSNAGEPVRLGSVKGGGVLLF